MAVPKRKVTRSRRNMRRSHDGLSINSAIISEPFNGQTRRRHHIDEKALVYRGRAVLTRLAQKRKAREQNQLPR